MFSLKTFHHMFQLLWHPRMWIVSEYPSKEVQDVQWNVDCAQALEISRTSLRTIMKKSLMFHLYKIMIVQKILPRDPVQRLQFSDHMLNILQGDLAVIITWDEEHFHLDGHINKQNRQYWAKENPREYTRYLCTVKKLPCGVLCQRLGDWALFFWRWGWIDGDGEFRAICGYASGLFLFFTWRKMIGIFHMSGFNRRKPQLTPREF